MNQWWLRHWLELRRLVGSFCSIYFIKSRPVYDNFLHNFFLIDDDDMKILYLEVHIALLIASQDLILILALEWHLTEHQDVVHHPQ